MPAVNLPYTLTADTAADAAQVQANDNANKDVLNGGIDAANVASAAITTAKLVSPQTSLWRPIFWDHAYATSANVLLAGTQHYHFNAPIQGRVTVMQPTITGDNKYVRFFGVDATTLSDYALASMTTKVRIVCNYSTNAVSSGKTFTPGLYAVSTVGGVSGSLSYGVNLTPVLQGDSFTPGAAVNGRVGTTVPITLVAGLYFLGFQTVGAMTTDSTVKLTMVLEMRHE